jgi:hypothetical protein
MANEDAHAGPAVNGIKIKEVNGAHTPEISAVNHHEAQLFGGEEVGSGVFNVLLHGKPAKGR